MACNVRVLREGSEVAAIVTVDWKDVVEVTARGPCGGARVKYHPPIGDSADVCIAVVRYRRDRGGRARVRLAWSNCGGRRARHAVRTAREALVAGRGFTTCLPMVVEAIGGEEGERGYVVVVCDKASIKPMPRR